MSAKRKLGVSKPRLRDKGGGEVAIPAYAAMQENGLSERVLDVLMGGLDAAVRRGAAGDGGDLRRVQVEREPGSGGGRRGSAARDHSTGFFGLGKFHHDALMPGRTVALDTL